jgi:hypothetical protein
MEADNNTVLEMAKTFNFTAFWELNLEQNESGQDKEFEFKSIEKPIYDPESPAGQIWPNGRVQNILQMSVRPITKEKAVAVKTEVERNFENMKEMALEKSMALNNPVPILRKEVGEILETIDPAKLEGLASGFMPDFSKYPENTVHTLAKVMFVQWVFEKIEATENGKYSQTEITEPYLNQLPEPLKWEKGNNDLYLLFVELVERGFLDQKTEWRKIARWLKMAFDIEPSVESIADEMSRVKSKKNQKPPQLPRNGKEIKNIFDIYES